jgi:demethylmenaquinone methyltransferase/2-methoxy-6-polyprenyl-1,4-benzoquinol methylase
MSTRRDFFNQAAANWDKQFQTEKLTKFLEKFVPAFGIQPGQKVLDAGTGTGVLIPFLTKAVGPAGHVTAVDFAEKMVDACKAKYGQLPNVSVQVENVEKLSFPNKSFDVVVCFGLFPHIVDKEVALKEINRVLKPEGKLVIVHALGSDEIEAHHHKNHGLIIAHDVLPQRSEMKWLLKETGFRETTIVDEPGRYLCTAYKA